METGSLSLLRCVQVTKVTAAIVFLRYSGFFYPFVSYLMSPCMKEKSSYSQFPDSSQEKKEEKNRLEVENVDMLANIS